ncbi:MAG: hypothetical protein NVSMB31_12690 [Vulcanimicrobiaceae bacterium]
MTGKILNVVFFALMGALMLYQASRPRYAEAKFLRGAFVLVASGLVLFAARPLVIATEPSWLLIVRYVWAAAVLALVVISRYRKEQNPNLAMADFKAKAGAGLSMTLATVNPSHKNGEEIG